MMLVMIKGSVSDETLPVDTSIPVVRKKNDARQRAGEKDFQSRYSSTHHLVESVQQQWK